MLNNVEPLRGLPSVARTALVISVIVAIVAFIGFVIFKALSVVLVFFVAIIIGEALRPLVDRFAKHVNRSLAIVIVLMALGLVGTALSALLIQTLTPQMSSAVQLLSRYASEIAGLLEGWLGPGVRDQFLRFITGNAAPIGLGFIEAQKSIAATLSTALLVILITAFWLASSDALCASLLGLVPLRLRSAARDLFSEMGTTLGLYAGGVLLNGSIVALGSTIILSLLHAPAPLVLGIFQGLLVSVPYLGTLVAVLTAGGVVLAAQGWQSALETIAFLSVMEGFEGSFISPLIFKKRLDLNPLTTVLATATGGALLGVTGVVLAVPVAALLHTVLDHALESAAGESAVRTNSRKKTADGKPGAHAVSMPPD